MSYNMRTWTCTYSMLVPEFSVYMYMYINMGLQPLRAIQGSLVFSCSLTTQDIKPSVLHTHDMWYPHSWSPQHSWWGLVLAEKNASCALGDCLTSRPEGQSPPREYSCTCTHSVHVCTCTCTPWVAAGFSQFCKNIPKPFHHVYIQSRYMYMYIHSVRYWI